MPDILFKNANLVLPGFMTLRTGCHVLVRGNQIETVSSDPIDAEGAMVVDVAGKTLMPGLSTHMLILQD
jgi:imidazolonepropionase-like amidohydrolase